MKCPCGVVHKYCKIKPAEWGINIRSYIWQLTYNILLLRGDKVTPTIIFKKSYSFYIIYFLEI